MKSSTSLLIQQFAKMSGDQKIRLALKLSETVRRVRETGAEATQTAKHSWIPDNKISSSR